MMPFFDTLNYHYVIMDWRGFFSNKDKNIDGYDRGLDGYDAVEWITEQNWSNCQIGTSGGSALGMIQFQTARHQPPHLVCSAPWIKDFKSLHSNYFYGGVLRFQHIQTLQNLGFSVPISVISAMYLYSTFWQNMEERSSYSDEFSIPMFIVTGWFDHFPEDVIRAFNDICNNSKKDVRDKHKLMVGPWTHSGIGQVKQGDLEYPEAQAIPQQRLKMFFDYYLLHAKNGWPIFPKVEYFDSGANEWGATDDILFSNVDTTKLYFSKSNLLQTSIPSNEKDFHIIYDPKDPSPTIGGSIFDPFNSNVKTGPVDQSPVFDDRDDFILFTSNENIEKISIYGSAKIKLHVSSDRTDTDFAVRLCDVYPDETWYLLTQAIHRMRFRNTFSAEELIIPDEIYTVEISLEPLIHTFQKGHRLGLIITSSNYPMFDINLNNGEALYQTGDTLIANNKVLVGGSNPSHISIPIQKTSSIEYINRNENVITIYPNPTKDYINIELSETGTFDFSLFNLLGNLILTRTINSNISESQHKINTNSLENGLYFIKCIRNKNTYIRKILIYK